MAAIIPQNFGKKRQTGRPNLSVCPFVSACNSLNVNELNSVFGQQSNLSPKPHNLMNRKIELRKINWFADIRACPVRQTLANIVLARRAAEQDDRQPPPAVERRFSFQNIDAVRLRDVEVKQHESGLVGAFAGHVIEHFLAVGKVNEFEWHARFFEREADEHDIRRAVFHDEHFAFLFHNRLYKSLTVNELSVNCRLAKEEKMGNH